MKTKRREKCRKKYKKAR